jgi:hypothetical protein
MWKDIIGRPRLLCVSLLLSLVAVIGALTAASSAGSTVTPYRIPMFGCADGAPGSNLVPADTPLFVRAGWFSGTRGLVQSAINNTTSTVTDLRMGVETLYHPVWGPIQPVGDGTWVAFWRVDLPPLALGNSATVTMTQSLAHPQVDLLLPAKDSDQPGLQYFNIVPAGLTPQGGEPNPTVCTITAT